MTGCEIRCAIELRADDTRQSPGHLYGVLMTYGQRSRDRAEMFLDGSLAWPNDGIIINRQHKRDSPIMRVVPELRGNQVVIDSPLPDTTAGRDAAQEIRDGLLKGLSVEFKARSEQLRGGIRQIASAFLPSAALVDSPSYDTTVEVRSKGRGRIWL